MKKTRFTEEQMVTILREADTKPVPDVAKKHGVSAQTIYSWRKHFGSLEPSDVKRLRQLEQENGRLKKMVADRDLEIDNPLLLRPCGRISRPRWKHQLACETQAAYRSCPGVRSVVLRWSFARQGRAATLGAGSGVARIFPGVAESVILATIQGRRENKSSVQAGPPRCQSRGSNARRVPISFLNTCLSARRRVFSMIDCATTLG